LRKGDDSIAKQAQWGPQGRRWEEEDLGIPRKVTWKCGRRDSGTAGGRWKRQHKTELDEVEEKWSVAYAPPWNWERQGTSQVRRIKLLFLRVDDDNN